MMTSRSLLTLLLDTTTSEADLFLDDRAEAHALVRKEGLLLRLRGRPFRLWLTERSYDLTGEVPRPATVSAIRDLLEARARRGPRQVLWNRVARCPEGALWLDLGDGRASRITASGLDLEHRPPPLFRRFSHQQPLPTPADRGDLLRLRDLLNLQREDDAVLFLSSLVVALVPDIPQPLLVLHGPQGAAKTTAARLRRKLIDPSAAPTVIVRRDVGELVQALDHHYMPILDNVQTLSPWQEEVLCQAATGGAFTKRALYSDEDDVLFQFCRPLVLTGISLPTAAPDLLDRALLIGLDPIPAAGRRGERRLWAAFREQHPALLGGLLTTLAMTLTIEPTLEQQELTRMADFTRLGAAAAEALGFGAGRFQQALLANVVKQGEQVVEENPVAEAIVDLMQRTGGFSGTASQLVLMLQEDGGPKRHPRLPRDPAELGRRLNALRVPLAQLGIQIRSQRHNGGNRQRCWIIEGQAAAARSV